MDQNLLCDVVLWSFDVFLTVHFLTRKSDIKLGPRYSEKVGSKVEVNAIYREESEGTQGSS